MKRDKYWRGDPRPPNKQKNHARAINKNVGSTFLESNKFGIFGQQFWSVSKEKRVSAFREKEDSLWCM